MPNQVDRHSPRSPPLRLGEVAAIVFAVVVVSVVFALEIQAQGCAFGCVSFPLRCVIGRIAGVDYKVHHKIARDNFNHGA